MRRHATLGRRLSMESASILADAAAVRCPVHGAGGVAGDADPDEHVEQIKRYIDLGFRHLDLPCSGF